MIVLHIPEDLVHLLGHQDLRHPKWNKHPLASPSASSLSISWSCYDQHHIFINIFTIIIVTPIIIIVYS